MTTSRQRLETLAIALTLQRNRVSGGQKREDTAQARTLNCTHARG